MAAEPLDRVTGVLGDAFHIGVGAGVLTFQRAQVRRRELTEQLGTYADTTRAQLEWSPAGSRPGQGPRGAPRALESRLE